MNVNVHIDCDAKLVDFTYVVNMFDYFNYLRQHHYLLDQLFIDFILDLNGCIIILKILNNRIWWNFDNFSLCWHKNLNFSGNVFNFFLNNKAFNFVYYLLDLLSANLNLEGYFNYLLNLFYFLNYGCLQPLLYHWNINCDFFIVN